MIELGANKATARAAGFIYLIVVVTGIFSLAYVPSVLIDWKDAAKTFANISGSEMLFRAGLVSSVVCYAAFLMLPLLLYRLLASVNETAARLMVLLSVVSVPISMINLQNKYAVLSIIRNAELLGFGDRSEIQAQIMRSLENYDNGILIVSVFWGLWLFPFGWLVYRSGFLPRALGVLLMLGCVGYLVGFIGNTMFDGYGGSFIAGIASKPAAFGEIGTCLWLLTRGINETAVRQDV